MANEEDRSKQQRLGKIAAFFMRLITSTMRVKLHDHCGFLEKRPDRPVIHALWHNAIFSWPYVYRKYWGDRNGAALTSASKDGEVVAAALNAFGIGAVRGSNSRRGAAAILELVKWIKKGHDIAITPDGPRGPKYKLSPGLVLLSQRAEVKILPFRFEYSNAIKLKTWDQFQVPIPFSRVDVHLGPYLEVPPTATEAEFEAQRLRIEGVLCGQDPDGAKPGEASTIIPVLI